MLEILHVEDDDICARFISSFALPHEKITHVYTGEQAIELCKRKKFDLLLMDIGLAGMNGTKCAELIYREHPVSLVFLTNHDKLLGEEKIEEINRHPNVKFCCVISKKNADNCKQGLEKIVDSIAALKSFKRHSIENETNKSLSSTEIDIYLDFKKKMTAKEIAKKRNVSPSTVYAYKSSILQKIRDVFRERA